MDFNPIQDKGRGGGRLRKFDPQNFLTFSFNPFATLVQNFQFLPIASPNLFNLNQDHHSEKAIFLVKSLKNLGYDNFSYRNAAVTKLDRMTASII